MCTILCSHISVKNKFTGGRGGGRGQGREMAQPMYKQFLKSKEVKKNNKIKIILQSLKTSKILPNWFESVCTWLLSLFIHLHS
jgi:hypothetical protein